jgi:GT2 family glycosyltransferase
MADFTILVLNWNGMEILPRMLESVEKQVSASHGALVVFDNGSDDGSDHEAQRLMEHHPWFTLIRSPENLGFAAGVNKAMRSIHTEVVVIANSDTRFLPGSLDNLINGLMRHEKAGLAGPRLLWPGGGLQPSMRDFPFPGRLVKEHLPFFRERAQRNRNHEKEVECDWLVGAVMAVRNRAFRAVGGFDEDYFFYHEETDLQYRLLRAGWETWFIPSSLVIHLEGASARRKFGEDVYLRYIPAKLRFLKKHAGPGSRFVFRLWMTGLMLGRMTAGFLNSSLQERDGRYRSEYCRKALGLLYGNTEREIT